MGLDISSTTIGLSLIGSNGSEFTLEDYDYYKPDKKCSLFEALSKTKKYIIKTLDKWHPDVVVIEEIAEHFSISTSKTIVKLTTYNRIVGLTVYENSNTLPVMMNVNTARSIIRPKSHKGRLMKEDVPEVVAAIMKCDFPWVLKKTGKKADESYDIADSIAVALAVAALDSVKNDKKSKK